MKWELEEGGTLGAGGESSPVQYPRSDEERAGGGNTDPAANGNDDANNEGGADTDEALDSDHSNDSSQPA